MHDPNATHQALRPLISAHPQDKQPANFTVGDGQLREQSASRIRQGRHHADNTAVERGDHKSSDARRSDERRLI
jgi:hypothetical protein